MMSITGHNTKIWLLGKNSDGQSKALLYAGIFKAVVPELSGFQNSYILYQTINNYNQQVFW